MAGYPENNWRDTGIITGGIQVDCRDVGRITGGIHGGSGGTGRIIMGVWREKK